MTIETSGESGAETTTNDQSQGTGQDGIQTSTDQSPEAIAAAEAAAAAAANQTPEQKAEADAATAAAATAAAAAAAETAGKAWADLDEDTKKFVGDKTPAQVAKELMNAQALLGKKSIGIPTKDSTPEEHRAFHKARGVPETEADYDLAPAMEELKKTAPEGWNPSPETEASFRKAARLANISQGEANEFAKHYLGDQFKEREELVRREVTATKDASAMLAKEWGPDRTVGEANFARGMKAVGLPADSVDVFLAAYGADGAARFNMVKAVAEIGRRQLEGGPIPGGQPGGNGAGMTKEQAITEQSRIKADPELSKAFMDVNHARHKEISNEMARLGKIERGIAV